MRWPLLLSFAVGCHQPTVHGHPPDGPVDVLPTIDLPPGVVMVPSNGVIAMSPGTVDVTIGVLTTFDTDTGAVTGGITRAAGEGIAADVGFHKTSYSGAPLGVFSFHNLTVGSTGVVHFTGAAAAVFVADSTIEIDGMVDGSGGCYGGSRACAGPGGGAGAAYGATAGGCGPGGQGSHDIPTGADTGGGGGGGGGNGSPGGIETASATMFPGGAAGSACFDLTLQPLVGGSGGGGGGPGAVTSTSGGGGGGALQLSAFDAVSITGTIVMGGAGGDGGPADLATTNPNGGAGGGGGGGGAILIEAPYVALATVGTIAANGGGGGGGSAQANMGKPGSPGGANATPAPGGAGGGSAGAGGNGGAGTTAPTAGIDANSVNAGAGAGGVGRVFTRSASSMFAGTISPPATTGPLMTR
jgi:hypothetical protein